MKNDSLNLSKNEMVMVMHDQEQEIERLKAKVSELQATIDNYEIKVEEAGTLAEASAQINNLFEAAQATVETYIENMKKRAEKSEEILADVQKQADGIISEAEAVHRRPRSGTFFVAVDIRPFRNNLSARECLGGDKQELCRNSETAIAGNTGKEYLV